MDYGAHYLGDFTTPHHWYLGDPLKRYTGYLRNIIPRTQLHTVQSIGKSLAIKDNDREQIKPEFDDLYSLFLCTSPSQRRAD